MFIGRPVAAIEAWTASEASSIWLKSAAFKVRSNGFESEYPAAARYSLALVRS